MRTSKLHCWRNKPNYGASILESKPHTCYRLRSNPYSRPHFLVSNSPYTNTNTCSSALTKSYSQGRASTDHYVAPKLAAAMSHGRSLPRSVSCRIRSFVDGLERLGTDWRERMHWEALNSIKWGRSYETFEDFFSLLNIFETQENKIAKTVEHKQLMSLNLNC